jgi:hypothetical protein
MATKYTPGQLEHHLSYEILMLNGAYALILQVDNLLKTGGASCLQREDAMNAMKEDFCLHARALLEFFTEKRTNSASDFATSAYNPGKAPDKMMQKLNNQILHFMDNRTDVYDGMIQGEDRDVLLRWLADELRGWVCSGSTTHS